MIDLRKNLTAEELALKERIKEAREIYSPSAVALALSLVAISDADGAYIQLQDFGEFEAAEAVEFIYFEQ